MDRFGPRIVMELGVALMAAGLLLAPLTTQPWHLYLTIGVLVGAGSICLGYSGQSLFLPNWFSPPPRPCDRAGIRRRRHRLDHAAAVGAAHDRADRLAHRLHRDGDHGAGRAGADQSAAAQAAAGSSGSSPTATRRTSASVDAGVEYRRSGMGRHRLDLAARASHRAVLVDRARLFLRIVHLVRGAGAPDQISARHRLQPQRRGVGAGRGQPARHSRPDRARTSVRPGRAGMDLGRELPRLCDLLCGAGRAEICSDACRWSI